MMHLFISKLLFLALFLQNEDQIGWKEAIQFGPTVVILFMLLAFLIRIAPIWKEIRLREIDMRSEENVVKREQAAALGQLANVLQVIAVEQRKATEEVNILQRVNASSADELNSNLKRFVRYVEEIDGKFEGLNSQKDKSEQS